MNERTSVPPVNASLYSFAAEVEEVFKTFFVCWVHETVIIDIAFIFHIIAMSAVHFDLVGSQHLFFTQFILLFYQEVPTHDANSLRFHEIEEEEHSPFSTYGYSKSYGERIWIALLHVKGK